MSNKGSTIYSFKNRKKTIKIKKYRRKKKNKLTKKRKKQKRYKKILSGGGGDFIALEEKISILPLSRFYNFRNESYKNMIEYFQKNKVPIPDWPSPHETCDGRQEGDNWHTIFERKKKELKELPEMDEKSGEFTEVLNQKIDEYNKEIREMNENDNNIIRNEIEETIKKEVKDDSASLLLKIYLYSIIEGGADQEKSLEQIKKVLKEDEEMDGLAGAVSRTYKNTRVFKNYEPETLNTLVKNITKSINKWFERRRINQMREGNLLDKINEDTEDTKIKETKEILINKEARCMTAKVCRTRPPGRTPPSSPVGPCPVTPDNSPDVLVLESNFSDFLFDNKDVKTVEVRNDKSNIYGPKIVFVVDDGSNIQRCSIYINKIKKINYTPMFISIKYGGKVYYISLKNNEIFNDKQYSLNFDKTDILHYLYPISMAPSPGINNENDDLAKKIVARSMVASRAAWMGLRGEEEAPPTIRVTAAQGREGAGIVLTPEWKDYLNLGGEKNKVTKEIINKRCRKPPTARLCTPTGDENSTREALEGEGDPRAINLPSMDRINTDSPGYDAFIKENDLYNKIWNNHINDEDLIKSYIIYFMSKNIIDKDKLPGFSNIDMKNVKEYEDYFLQFFTKDYNTIKKAGKSKGLTNENNIMNIYNACKSAHSFIKYDIINLYLEIRQMIYGDGNTLIRSRKDESRDFESIFNKNKEDVNNDIINWDEPEDVIWNKKFENPLKGLWTQLKKIYIKNTYKDKSSLFWYIYSFISQEDKDNYEEKIESIAQDSSIFDCYKELMNTQDFFPIDIDNDNICTVVENRERGPHPPGPDGPKDPRLLNIVKEDIKLDEANNANEALSIIQDLLISNRILKRGQGVEELEFVENEESTTSDEDWPKLLVMELKKIKESEEEEERKKKEQEEQKRIQQKRIQQRGSPTETTAVQDYLWDVEKMENWMETAREIKNTYEKMNITCSKAQSCGCRRGEQDNVVNANIIDTKGISNMIDIHFINEIQNHIRKNCVNKGKNNIKARNEMIKMINDQINSGGT